MKPLTGRRVLAIALAAFATILAPNLVLAYYASTTFAGLIVPNSYVASQHFNERTRAQEALGWSLALELVPDGLLLGFTDEAGAVVRPATLAVTVGRPTMAADDRVLALTPTRAGWLGPVTLEPGNWLVLVTAEAEDGTLWKQRRSLAIAPRS